MLATLCKNSPRSRGAGLRPKRVVYGRVDERQFMMEAAAWLIEADDRQRGPIQVVRSSGRLAQNLPFGMG